MKLHHIRYFPMLEHPALKNHSLMIMDLPFRVNQCAMWDTMLVALAELDPYPNVIYETIRHHLGTINLRERWWRVDRFEKVPE